MKTITICIPSMGESITEATIARLIIPSGKEVQADEEILELETEKVNQPLYAQASGRVQWKIEEGEQVQVGDQVGVIHVQEEKGDDPPTPLQREPILKSLSLERDSEKEEDPRLSLSLRHSREEFAKEMLKEKVVSPPPVQRADPESGTNRKKMSPLRKTLAEKLVRTQKETAMVTTFNEIDLSCVLSIRKRYQTLFEKQYGIRLGFLSFFVKSLLYALRTFPELTSYIEEDEIITRTTYDIGIAVSTERGLLVPILHNCDSMSFAQIEQMIAELAKKAREGKLTLDELRGGSLTISNGGVFGSLLSTPTLPPMQSAILGLHTIQKRAVVVEEAIVIRPMMYVALTYDHRLIDGREAVCFLKQIKECIEDPVQLLF